jgi:hypothetical protein
MIKLIEVAARWEVLAHWNTNETADEDRLDHVRFWTIPAKRGLQNPGHTR